MIEMGQYACDLYYFPEGISNGANWYIIKGGMQVVKIKNLIYFNLIQNEPIKPILIFLRGHPVCTLTPAHSIPIYVTYMYLLQDFNYIYSNCLELTIELREGLVSLLAPYVKYGLAKLC